MRKSITYLILSFFFLSGVMGQDYLNYPGSWAPVPGPDKYYKDSVKQAQANVSKLPPLRVKLNLGTSFSTGGYYGNSVQSWVAPEINYQVSNRLNLRVGVAVSNNYMTSLPGFQEGNMSRASNSWFNYKVYVSGDYMINENLVVSGTLMKSIDQTPAWVGRPSYYNQNYESMSMSVHYRINDYMTVGAGIQINRGDVPYYYNPMMQPYGNQLSPFAPSPYY